MTRYECMSYVRPSEQVSAALELISVPDLKTIAVFHPDAIPRTVTRKADFVNAVEKRLNGRYLRNLLGAMTELEKLVIAETIHNNNGVLNIRRLSSRFGENVGRLFYYVRPLGRLRLLIYAAERHSIHQVVPDDLRERLLPLIPPPPGENVRSFRDLPVHDRLAEPGTHESKVAKFAQRNMEAAAIRDFAAVVRLIENSKISVGSKTGQPTAASVRNIASVLYGGDFYAPDIDRLADPGVGSIRAFAWPLLLRTAKLVQIRGSKLELTRAGRRALSEPPTNTLKRLLASWCGNKLFDEFSRIDLIKGQRGKGKRGMTEPAHRRWSILEALRECPVGAWVELGEFSRFIRATDSSFEVTTDPWNLYVGDSHYGGLGHVRGEAWQVFQEQYLLCFLFEYIATLGLIDVVYQRPDGSRSTGHTLWAADVIDSMSRYDGLAYFRLNALGAYCLELCDSYELAEVPVQTRISVRTNLSVEVQDALSAEEELLLENYAVRESGNLWRLDRARIIQAIESGAGVDQLRTFLSARDDQALPDLVEGFLKQVERDSQALTVRGPAVIFDCASVEVAERIAADKICGKLCQCLGRKSLAITAASETRFRNAVRDLGLGFSVP